MKTAPYSAKQKQMIGTKRRGSTQSPTSSKKPRRGKQEEAITEGVSTTMIEAPTAVSETNTYSLAETTNFCVSGLVEHLALEEGRLVIKARGSNMQLVPLYVVPGAFNFLRMVLKLTKVCPTTRVMAMHDHHSVVQLSIVTPPNPSEITAYIMSQLQQRVRLGYYSLWEQIMCPPPRHTKPPSLLVADLPVVASDPTEFIRQTESRLPRRLCFRWEDTQHHIKQRRAILNALPRGGKPRLILQRVLEDKGGPTDHCRPKTRVPLLSTTLVVTSPPAVSQWRAEAEALGLRVVCVTYPGDFGKLTHQQISNADVMVLSEHCVVNAKRKKYDNDYWQKAVRYVATSEEQVRCVLEDLRVSFHQKKLHDALLRWTTRYVSEVRGASMVPLENSYFRRVVIDGLENAATCRGLKFHGHSQWGLMGGKATHEMHLVPSMLGFCYSWYGRSFIDYSSVRERSDHPSQLLLGALVRACTREAKPLPALTWTSLTTLTIQTPAEVLVQEILECPFTDFQKFMFRVDPSRLASSPQLWRRMKVTTPTEYRRLFVEPLVEKYDNMEPIMNSSKDRLLGAFYLFQHLVGRILTTDAINRLEALRLVIQDMCPNVSAVIHQEEELVPTHDASQIPHAMEQVLVCEEGLTDAISDFNRYAKHRKDLTRQVAFHRTNIRKFEDRTETCPVCYEGTNTILPCGHLFCAPCIQHALWLKEECPVCKADAETVTAVRLVDSEDDIKVATYPSDPLTQTALLKTLLELCAETPTPMAFLVSDNNEAMFLAKVLTNALPLRKVGARKKTSRWTNMANFLASYDIVVLPEPHKRDMAHLDMSKFSTVVAFREVTNHTMQRFCSQFTTTPVKLVCLKL